MPTPESSKGTGQVPPVGTGAQLSPMARKLVADPHYYGYLVLMLVLLSALGSFVNDMYSPALPAMCRFFGCSIPAVQMGMTVGMAGLAVGQLVMGPVSDHIGRRPVLLTSIIVFIISAIVSVFSPTITFFVICRFFQGLGASGGYFLARTVPADIFHGRPLAKLMALTGAINGFAPASAPVIGGITADAWGWKGIFVVLALFAVIILFATLGMKESLAPSMRSKGSIRDALKNYAVLLRNVPFMTHVSLKGVSLGLLFAYISATPFILQTHYGLTQTQYGLVIGANSLLCAAGSMVALRFKLLKRAAFVGALITALGVAAESMALWHVHSIWLFEVCITVVLFGLGLLFTAANTLAMNEGRSNAGEASAILGVGGYIAGAIVSPLVGIGNVLHSTALTFAAVTLLIVIFAFLSRRLSPDLNK